ncbi:hypothetical protein ATANTOWER_021227 [Ataeniobius toweri]|uniref:Uncharacterized protein n=1 Tax=Ataeniobius toweri TaxID=208326 RepID=A0ABU7C9K4_9TELE|nr:hypothetical protein [Ataeniobius toweri]
MHPTLEEDCCSLARREVRFDSLKATSHLVVEIGLLIVLIVGRIGIKSLGNKNLTSGKLLQRKDLVQHSPQQQPIHCPLCFLKMQSKISKLAVESQFAKDNLKMNQDSDQEGNHLEKLALTYHEVQV